MNSSDWMHPAPGALPENPPERSGHRNRRHVLKAGLVTGAALWSGAVRAQGNAPDMVLHGGTVHSGGTTHRVHEAVAIRDGRVMAVGDNRRLLDMAGSATRRVDLAGKAVIPGFIDAHPHMDGVGAKLLAFNWGEIRSVADVLGVVTREVSRLERGAWLVLPPFIGPPRFYGYPDALAEKRWPNRADLDRVAPDNPVYIEPHYLAAPGVAIANSAALRGGQLPPAGQDPDGTITVRDERGEPTGVFMDYNYPRLVPLRGWPRRTPFFPRIPSPPAGELKEQAVRTGMGAFARAGITGIYEGHGMEDSTIAVLQKLRTTGELTLRAYCPLAFPFSAYGDSQAADNVIERARRTAGGNGLGDDLLTLGGLGFSFDSAAGAGAALMVEPYRRPQGGMWRGAQLTSDANLRRALVTAAAAGLRLQVQCSGRAAIETTLGIFESIHQQSSIRDRRFAIEHCQFPTRDQMRRAHAMGVVPTTASTFLWVYGQTYLAAFGPDLSAEAIPFRSWFDSGLPIANSTDGEPYDPYLAFWIMLARKEGFGGRTLGTAEQVTREQALRAYTLNGAIASFRETVTGSLEPGKHADLVVLSQDIMTVEQDRIPDTRALATLLAGRPVHDTGVFG
ncbi:amidohydrolase [Reyranella sp. CPCC 100927]|uniref:amidohydrolase n=1 Tax=Reyranella sp. CPCC 100927 TaxID=2599616 RepID=UPI0011B6ADD7|nr:amidohydrolase [Reyranella sp. CPCC 100927]TWS94269.1 amidohydrolase [Reyranella sp. CPCC 100927]